MKHQTKWLSWLLICIICIGLGSSTGAYGSVNSPAAIKEASETLSGISAEEHRIIGELFEMSALIEWMNTEISRLNEEMRTLTGEIDKKQQLIEQEALSYEKAKANMAEVLRNQQRAGAASALDIILSARDLKDLIHRINVLRDLSRNTVALMDEIEATQMRLTAEQRALRNLLENRQAQQNTLSASYERQRSARLERERYLNALQTDKAHYEAALQTMEKRWKSLKPIFSDTVHSFNRMIESGGLPADTVAMTYSLFYAKGRISQDKLNAALSNRKELPRLKFGLQAGQVTLDFPDYTITLAGKFVRVDGHTLQYEVTGGTFYGYPMSGDALQDLFSAGDLVFDLGTMIGNHAIDRIDMHDGYIELTVS